jgi:hypothetical protein
MKDAENLVKLLVRAEPEYFKSVLGTQFGTDLPDIDPAEGKRSVRDSFAQVLSFIPFQHRRELDEWAERINLLADAPGQDAVQAIRQDRLDESRHEAFDIVGNQFDRSLWLFSNEPRFFQEALDIRLATVFRQSATCYSGYLGPKSLTLKDDTESLNSFHASLAKQFNCPPDQVSVEVFRRVHPDSETGDDVSLYQVNIHHNLAPEVVDCVKHNRLDSTQITRAVCAFVTYEPSNGTIEVLSKDKGAREELARNVADLLLESPISGERIPLKQYHFQCLAEPFSFDVAGEKIEWVKVTQLGYSVSGRTTQFRITAKDMADIHTAACSEIGAHFRFSDHSLTMATISLRVRKQTGERARTVQIALRGQNGCNIKTKREKDRTLCDCLLERWGIVQEVGHELSAAANNA